MKLSFGFIDLKRIAKYSIIWTIIIIGFGLRLARLPFLTMWSDEYHSFRVSSLPLMQILNENYTSDLNPPLYFVLLHLLRHFTGNVEIAMRSLSLFFSLLSLPIFYLLAVSIFKTFIPSIAALTLMAFHPMLIYYSDEIRSYSLLVFFSLLAFLSCVFIYDKARRPLMWTILLTFSLTGCIYTHHFGIVVPAAILAFVLFKILIFRQWSKYEAASLLGIGITCFLYLPGLVLLRKQISVYPEVVNKNQIFRTFQIFVFSIEHPQYEQLLLVITLITFALGLIILISQSKDKPTMFLVVLGIVSGFFITFIASMIGINTTNRYLLPIIPLVLIAIAATMNIKKKGWYRIIYYFAMIGIMINIIFGIDFVMNTKLENQQVKWKADWRQISEVIKEIRISDETIVLMGWDSTPIQFYLGESGINSYELEQQLLYQPHPSYLLVMTPNSRSISVLESAELIYEDKVEGISILRLRTYPISRFAHENETIKSDNDAFLTNYFSN